MICYKANAGFENRVECGEVIYASKYEIVLSFFCVYVGFRQFCTYLYACMITDLGLTDNVQDWKTKENS